MLSHGLTSNPHFLKNTLLGPGSDEWSIDPPMNVHRRATASPANRQIRPVPTPSRPDRLVHVHPRNERVRSVRNGEPVEQLVIQIGIECPIDHAQDLASGLGHEDHIAAARAPIEVTSV